MWIYGRGEKWYPPNDVCNFASLKAAKWHSNQGGVPFCRRAPGRMQLRRLLNLVRTPARALVPAWSKFQHVRGRGGAAAGPGGRRAPVNVAVYPNRYSVLTFLPTVPGTLRGYLTNILLSSKYIIVTFYTYLIGIYSTHIMLLIWGFGQDIVVLVVANSKILKSTILAPYFKYF